MMKLFVLLGLLASCQGADQHAMQKHPVVAEPNKPNSQQMTTVKPVNVGGHENKVNHVQNVQSVDGHPVSNIVNSASSDNVHAGESAVPFYTEPLPVEFADKLHTLQHNVKVVLQQVEYFLPQIVNEYLVYKQQQQFHQNGVSLEGNMVGQYVPNSSVHKQGQNTQSTASVKSVVGLLQQHVGEHVSQLAPNLYQVYDSDHSQSADRVHVQGQSQGQTQPVLGQGQVHPGQEQVHPEQGQVHPQGQGQVHPGQDQGQVHPGQGQGQSHPQGQEPVHPQGQGQVHPQGQGQGQVHPEQGQVHPQGQGQVHPEQGQVHPQGQGQGQVHPGQDQGQVHPGQGQGPVHPQGQVVQVPQGVSQPSYIVPGQQSHLVKHVIAKRALKPSIETMPAHVSQVDENETQTVGYQQSGQVVQKSPNAVGTNVGVSQQPSHVEQHPSSQSPFAQSPVVQHPVVDVPVVQVPQNPAVPHTVHKREVNQHQQHQHQHQHHQQQDQDKQRVQDSNKSMQQPQVQKSPVNVVAGVPVVPVVPQHQQQKQLQVPQENHHHPQQQQRQQPQHNSHDKAVHEAHAF